MIKIGAQIVRHAYYVTLQMTEVTPPKEFFEQILSRIARLMSLCDTG